MDNTDWVKDELCELELGDQRLNKRVAAMLRALANRPDESVQGAFHARAERVGAYRVLRNEHVQTKDLVDVHAENTLRRASTFERVLCISDTCFISYPHRDLIEGMGPFNRIEDNGFFLQVNFAVSDQGVCLGTLKASTFTRDPALDKRGTQANRKLEEKENQRWADDWQAVEQAQLQLQQAGSSTKLMCVTDSEGDFYELIAMASEGSADFLIRSQGDRLLPSGQRIGERPKDLTPLGRISFELPARRGLEPRVVKQTLYSARVPISAQRKGKRTEAVEVTVLWAMEDNPPSSQKPVNWVLISNVPVTNMDEAIALVNCYRLRWRIEMLFDALKNTCKVERLRLHSLEAIEKLCAFYLITAWRVLYLMTLGREHPDLPATLCFDAEELSLLTLSQKLTTRQPPKKLDTMGKAIEALARLGGYQPRKKYSPPGLRNMTRGYARLLDFVAYKALLQGDFRLS